MTDPLKAIDRATRIGGASAAIAVACTVAAAVFFFPTDKSFEIKVDAPTAVHTGELVVLDVSATGADSYAYSVTPPAKCLTFDNGTKLVTALPGGEYTFVIAAAKGGQVSIAEHTITVEGGPGPPTPGPATFATRLKQAIATVKDEAKAEHLTALGGTFSTVASMIGAGVLTDPEEIVTATLNLNTEALGDAHGAWKPVRDCISAEMSARAEAGDLETPEQHASVWKEIAALLKGAS